jgi:hypothetical protein
MKVVDQEPHAWFLLEDDGALYLDVHCSHSAIDYSVLIALDPAERSAYESGGHAYLDQLAYGIHYSAPGVRGSASPFKDRNLAVGPGGESRRANAAIEGWRADQAG